MLLKAEFDSNVGYLAPSIEAMLQAGEELMSSQRLQDLFYMVLIAGNFLNSVSWNLESKEVLIWRRPNMTSPNRGPGGGNI